MKDKKQDVNSLEELVKTADSYRAFFANLADELSKVLADIKIHEEEEKTWEMKCPYENGDEYWVICESGDFEKVIWYDYDIDKEIFNSGNAFLTKQAAELEAKRRNLLTRFRAFRDECNGDWKADWSDYDKKWSISKDKDELFDTWTMGINTFVTFGYFKNKKDAQRAIELFGDEIKALFVDCEV